MKVIVPCCGQSSRFPNQPPKWMLPGHDGRPMLALALAGLDIPHSDIIVVILATHDEVHRASDGIRGALSDEVEIIVLSEPTASQSETVAKAIALADVTEPFLVKDSDNFFALDDLEQPDNYISVDSLNNHDLINPRNKSYLQVEHNGLVTNIREKEVISDLFSVGGYYFCEPGLFVEYYEKLAARDAEWERELYVSDIIGSMILDGTPFRARRVERYQDWGTIHEWRRTRLEKRTFFCLLDGLLMERGSEYFHPRFEDVTANLEAVEATKAVVAHGHDLVLLSIRPERYRDLTEAQLAEHGLSGIPVVYGCPVSTWVLATSPHSTLPFRTSHALELQADDPHLIEKLLDEN